MKKEIEEWLLIFGEITELQQCLYSVLEHCMFKGEHPYFALTLLGKIIDTSSKLYEDIDSKSLSMLE
ncbi:hypothetical protein IJZ97_00020 [bacterium]|nr:hypothetical protein [bacterium]